MIVINTLKQINYKQLIKLLVISRLVITLHYIPALLSPPGNQDVWISELISFPMILLLSAPIYLLGKKFPKKSIIQYSEILAGKGLKFFIGTIYSLFFLHFTALTLAQFSLFITTAILSETPPLFFAITMILVCSYAVWKGLEVIVRVGEIVAPILLAGILLILLLLIKDLEIKALLPILEKGFLPILNGGFTIAARTVEIIAIAMLIPFLNQRDKLKIVYLLSFSIIILFFLFVTVLPQTVFGVEQTKTITFPFFSAVRMVNVGEFLEHIEAIHMSIWLLGIIIKISLYYYLTTLSLQQTLNLKDPNYMIIPAVSIIVPLSILIAPNYEELRAFTSYKIFTWYALFFIFLIPFILLILSTFKKKEKTRHEN